MGKLHKFQLGFLSCHVSKVLMGDFEVMQWTSWVASDIAVAE
jgi:hypothetical protein